MSRRSYLPNHRRFAGHRGALGAPPVGSPVSATAMPALAPPIDRPVVSSPAHAMNRKAEPVTTSPAPKRMVARQTFNPQILAYSHELVRRYLLPKPRSIQRMRQFLPEAWEQCCRWVSCRRDIPRSRRPGRCAVRAAAASARRESPPSVGCPRRRAPLRASTNIGTLATLTAAGDPWASFVTYGLLGGAPVLCVSRMAEHGRNLEDDPRASLAIVAPEHRIRIRWPVAESRWPATCNDLPVTSGSPRGASASCGGHHQQVLHGLQRLLVVGAACRSGTAGWAATAGWTRRPARHTRRREPDPVSAAGRRARSLISTPTTPTRCVAMAQDAGRLSRTPPRPPAPAPTGTDST